MDGIRLKSVAHWNATDRPAADHITTSSRTEVALGVVPLLDVELVRDDVVLLDEVEGLDDGRVFLQYGAWESSSVRDKGK